MYMSARQKKLLLADARAMEKEANREAEKPYFPVEASPLTGGALIGAGHSSDCSEARGYGRTLGKHLLGVHGMGFAKDFMAGMSDGFSNNVEAKEAPKPRRGRGKSGAGPLEIDIKHESSSDEEEKKEMKGGLGTGRYEGEGKAGDKRKARAAVVRKVMMERKVSLPEASKIVKAEGLF